MLILAYPWVLALLPLPAAVWYFAPVYRQERRAVRVPFIARLSRITGRLPTAGAAVSARGRAASAALIGCWCLLVVALARPQRLEPPITRTIPVRDVMLAVDLSGSMQTKDFTDASGRSVDRLTAVKQVLDDFLARRAGDRVGLIVFGNSPFVQAPFTDDLGVCRELLAETQVGMAGPKTALGDAIGLAITVFDRSEVPERMLIVLTDGNDTGSQVPPEKAAEVARDKHVVIHTVAVGDPKAAGEAKLDEEALRHTAALTGGTYSHAGNRGELEAVYRRLDQSPTRAAATITHRPRTDLFVWPLAAALMLGAATVALIRLVHRRGAAAPVLRNQAA